MLACHINYFFFFFFKPHVENHSSNNVKSAITLHTDEASIPELSPTKEFHTAKPN